ncbi:phospholipid-transporting ATPase ABCA3-like [Aethina tumida]|uniref:phospholipid-transporting ATPase ABCA3-like n=1 Tax=Aethina tumida TaxID=116153 RepID=UPI0021481B14|nr:phospholipid-transporting ATPase ABCA3-like [Aethina tumida]
MESTSYTLITQNDDKELAHRRFKDRMARNWDKFVLLMWKNWLLQYRKPVQTVVELLAPVLFSILLVCIRRFVDPTHHDTVVFEPFSILNQLQNKSLTGNGTGFAMNLSIIYSPSTPETDKIMSPFEMVGCKLIPTNNRKELEEAYAMNETSLLPAIEFSQDFSVMNDNISITIRFPSELRTSFNLIGGNTWKTYLIYPLYQVAGPRSYNDSTGAPPNYFKEGFLLVQQVLTLLIVLERKNINIKDFKLNETTSWIRLLSRILTNDGVMEDVPIIEMRRFAYPSWNEDILLQMLISFCGIIFMLSFVYTCINTVKTITTEKEKQLKEAMKIMGLSNWLHWTAWFVKSFIFLIISAVLMVILLKVRWYPNTDITLFTYADPSVMLVFLIFYICATITFCFAVSVFFSKANTAATISGLAWFLSYTPYLFLQQKYDQLTLFTKLSACLGSNTAMSYGFQLMLMFEGTGEGIQWSNVFKTVTPDDNLSLAVVMAMLFIDCIIYLLIALYVEAVFPGEYGVGLPWYFPFTSVFWCGQPRNTGTNNYSPLDDNVGEYFEKVSNTMKPGIEIRNLRKVFGHNVAVNGLTLKMYQDQITVLLGHNGAGKTTTMSMLTGMFPPTSGTAIIDGYDIRTEMLGVRESLGLCPQHNILFDELTVKEHIYFFSKMKGLHKDEVANEINKYIALLELEPKRDAMSKTLSGGMKRKLCVGVALCGNSKVVMLDEPTAGMDPSARRALWELIQSQKEGRTMLLTTHFMDEADLLGDRIAIMARGELQCCGSSFFLKKKYGAGYHLIMDKSKDCDVDEVTELLRKHIPNIEVHSNIGSELAYLLQEDQVSLFEDMLVELEENFSNLKINGYGISLTTLEEVFMKVGADQGHGDMSSDDGYDNEEHFEEHNGTTVHIEHQPQILKGYPLMLNQIYAMIMKKILSSMRSWIILTIQILMPAVYLIIVMLVIKNSGNMKPLPLLKMDLDQFGATNTLIEYKDDGATNKYLEEYKNVVNSTTNTIIFMENITEHALHLRSESPTTFKYKYPIGAAFKRTSCPFNVFTCIYITAYFNNDALHSPGVTTSYVLNAVYRVLTDCPTCTITFNNYPLPYSTETQFQLLSSGQNLGFQLAFNVGFSMAFAASIFILFIIRERVSKSKHLQLVSGVKVSIFWCVTYICDFLVYIGMAIVFMVTLICFSQDGYKTTDEIGRALLILLAFGFSIIPLMYWSGFAFEVPSTGYTRMTLVSVFLGIVAFMVIQILATPGFDLEHVAHMLHWIFLLVPHYSMSTAFLDSFTLYQTNYICNNLAKLGNTNSSSFLKYCSDYGDFYFRFKEPGIGRNILYSLLVGAVAFSALLIFDYKIFSNLMYKITLKLYGSNIAPQIAEDEDDDVTEEKLKIRNASETTLMTDYTFVMRDVTKYYGQFLAVNGLCLGAKGYECFGLLGINGAGKTTTFKMMTGDVKISYGDAWVNGLSIKNQLKEVQKYIGYCPQFDALLDDLTARESIKMFALLRGIPNKDCDALAENLARDFDFTKHLDKRVKQLSGGNKRKLSTSIALIGDPPVIYLDEPTTGMDPATKRYLWNALCKVRDSGKLIVLTSHSMEECEALCTRIAIMVNGNFKCLGSTQHLKNKFAGGYTLIIKIKKLSDSRGVHHSTTGPAEDFVKTNFPGAKLRERHQELLTYYITDTSLPWSKMFGILERAKHNDTLNIEDYSIGQSSLEQVFLTFTKLQR